VAENLRVTAGANVLHVPYKGGGPAMTDMLGGQVDFYISSLVSALPLIKDHKLRALAVTSGARDPSLPDVPTFIESGFKGFEYYTLYGVVVPAKTPENIVRTMNTEINRVLDSADVRANLAARGIYVRTGTPETFGTFLNGERKKWAEVVKATGAVAE
jgi:tripartite-type tricarboxylate transporter receptor subunit TctC